MSTRGLTSKAQTTIPQSVRVTLGLNPGDEIGYVIEASRVYLTRVSEERREDPCGTFKEWSGDADRRAYGDL
jgi:antitoxin PrlF